MSSDDNLAPIALFAFKRPEHLRRTLEALAQNPEFFQSDLHIFCDGARHAQEQAVVNETRAVAKNWPHPRKTLHEARANLGLAKSIISGVGNLCVSKGRVIVVEDDLIVSRFFLKFLNEGLDLYEDSPRVMQISGFVHRLPAGVLTDDSLFLPFTTSWGWATWGRAWKSFDPTMAGYDLVKSDRRLRWNFDLRGAYPYFSMLKRQRSGLIDSWAIRWYLSVFMSRGLVLYPGQSLVVNEGFDGSGTHCANIEQKPSDILPSRPLKLRKIDIAVDEFMYEKIIAVLNAERSGLLRSMDFIRRVLMI